MSMMNQLLSYMWVNDPVECVEVVVFEEVRKGEVMEKVVEDDDGSSKKY